jgi:hypothetical protein
MKTNGENTQGKNREINKTTEKQKGTIAWKILKPVCRPFPNSVY